MSQYQKHDTAFSGRFPDQERVPTPKSVVCLVLVLRAYSYLVAVYRKGFRSFWPLSNTRVAC